MREEGERRAEAEGKSEREIQKKGGSKIEGEKEGKRRRTKDR